MKRIMFVGPSGIGKTTLATFIETKYGIPFISGSMSDLTIKLIDEDKTTNLIIKKEV